MPKPAKGYKDKEGKYKRIVDYEFDDHWSHKWPELYNEIVQQQILNFIEKKRQERRNGKMS
jgi:hypothetical protein